MRKEYGNILRRLFARKIKESAPDFKEVKVESVYFWPGERGYCRIVDDHIKCWIVLSPSPKDYDEFTVMVGWSTLGRYPELSPIPSVIAPSNDRKEFDQAEYLIRLPQLWSNKDIWWVVKKFEPPLTIEQMLAAQSPILPEEAESKVAPLVEDAIKKVVTVGVPYLNAFVKMKTAKNG